MYGQNTIFRSAAASQLNKGQTVGATNQTDKVLANIVAETSSKADHIGSINHTEVPIPTVESKPRSFSYDSSMSSRCLTRQHTKTKRRYTFSAESITVENEFLSERNVPCEEHTRNVITEDKSQHKNSFRNGLFDKKSREGTNHCMLSQKLSSKSQQKTIEECYKVNYSAENMVDDDEASLKEINQLKHFPDSSIIENKTAERNNSQNLADKCPIRQRINQYLTNVMNDRDLELSQKRHNTSRKQQEHTAKKKWKGSRRISQKRYECSTGKHQDMQNYSRQKPRRLYSRNRRKYSRKHYWEEFEDFRNNLDVDARNKSEENHKETEKVEHHFQETFDRRQVCDKAKGETSDQFILRIFPKSHEVSRHGNKRSETPHRRYPNDSKRRNNNRKRLELDRVPKSKNTEASIWTYL